MCRVGDAPWGSLTQEQWDAYLKEFSAIYRRRPDHVNKDGGGFFHYFGLFITIRILRPTAVVESGAFRGVGTWFLRQAAGPGVKIVVVSPDQPSLYVDPAGLYLTGSNFVDFSKTTVEQWSKWVPDIRTTLIFFDDHQAEVQRLHKARALGFVHMMFDDNYPPSVGDNFSVKMVCSGMAPWRLLGLQSAVWKDNFNMVSRPMSPGEFQEKEQQFREDAAVYAEFPPVWKPINRFTEHISDASLEKLLERPLYRKDQLAALGLSEADTAGFDLEAAKYTFISYVRARRQNEGKIVV
jgi:hypothetical protein